MKAFERLNAIADVRRAWPAPGNTIVFETLDEYQRIRAGKIDADGTVTINAYATDGQLPTVAGATGDIVVHRLGRRAVEMRSRSVRKHLRASKVASAFGAAQLASRAARRCGLHVPPVIAVGQTYIDFEMRPGTSLAGTDCPESAWEAFYATWPGFAASTVEAATHDGTDEARVLATWVDHARTHNTLEAITDIAANTKTVAAVLTRTGDHLVTAHRDLHEKQMLWDGRHLSLLDGDTIARSEAALDLGNLAAHLELAAISGHIPTTTVNHRLGKLRDLAHTMHVSDRRLEAYTQAARLRTACVHSFRPTSTAWINRWIDHCLAH